MNEEGIRRLFFETGRPELWLLAEMLKENEKKKKQDCIPAFLENSGEHMI